MHLDEVCRQTDAHRYGGRVAVGHATKLSAVAARAPRRGRGAHGGCRRGRHGAAGDRPVPDGPRARPTTSRAAWRRRTGCISTASPARSRPTTCSTRSRRSATARSCAWPICTPTSAQIGGRAELAACFDMVTALPAKLMKLADYGITPGHPADIVVLDCRDRASAVAELAQPLFGLKRGRRSFTRAAPVLHGPASHSPEALRRALETGGTAPRGLRWRGRNLILCLPKDVPRRSPATLLYEMALLDQLPEVLLERVAADARQPGDLADADAAVLAGVVENPH